MMPSPKRLLLVTAVIASAAGSIFAQPQPSFAVASVKPSTPEDRRFGTQFLPGGRLVITGAPLHIIVATAYNVPFQSSRLTGAPDWIRSARYNIEATAESGAIPPGLSAESRKQRMRLMLQTLLAERFKLAIRREKKEMQVYALVVAKDGPKLEKSKVEEKDCPEARTSDGFSCHDFMGGQGRGLHAQAVSMADVVLYVENWTERPFIDKTGLKGLFKVDTRPWLPLRAGPAPAAGAKGEDGSDLADLPSLFDVFTNMGLKMVPQKASVDIFIITHIEKPIEN